MDSGAAPGVRWGHLAAVAARLERERAEAAATPAPGWDEAIIAMSARRHRPRTGGTSLSGSGCSTPTAPASNAPSTNGTTTTSSAGNANESNAPAADEHPPSSRATVSSPNHAAANEQRRAAVLRDLRHSGAMRMSDGAASESRSGRRGQGWPIRGPCPGRTPRNGTPDGATRPPPPHARRRCNVCEKGIPPSTDMQAMRPAGR